MSIKDSFEFYEGIFMLDKALPPLGNSVGENAEHESKKCSCKSAEKLREKESPDFVVIAYIKCP